MNSWTPKDTMREEFPYYDRTHKAKAFAIEAHNNIKQVRKYTGEPYWYHTNEVAETVFDTCLGIDNNVLANMVCAAHLHDVLEDVAPKNSQYSGFAIVKNFGLDVLTLVDELTDEFTREKYPEFNRKRRKQLECARLGKISREGKTIKLADLLSNTKSIVEHDPDFARTYLREIVALLPYLANGSPILLQKAWDTTKAGFAKLGMEFPIEKV